VVLTTFHTLAPLKVLRVKLKFIDFEIAIVCINSNLGMENMFGFGAEL
jgi:hypothetical protein